MQYTWETTSGPSPGTKLKDTQERLSHSCRPQELELFCLLLKGRLPTAAIYHRDAVVTASIKSGWMGHVPSPDRLHKGVAQRSGRAGECAGGSAHQSPW